MFYIWSNRRRQWWGAERSGYTDHIKKAGQYDQEEAGQIAVMGLPGANIAVETILEPKFIDLDANEVESQIDQLKRI